MARELHFLAYDQLPSVERGRGIVNHPIAGARQGATRIHSGVTWLPVGTSVPNHCHPNAEEQVTVLKGKVRIKLDAIERDCEPYDSTFISGGVAHEFSNIGTEPALVMVIYGVLRDSHVTRTFTDTGETVEIGSGRDKFSEDADA
ncbi:cupin domain-containing protein [Castellaniella hirudinis]|uniref:Cupin domain-containing protein n=1 Tax=Castellaniella hirudinis TaxID=1144617 RepID=A0ABV8RVE0_9BURK